MLLAIIYFLLILTGIVVVHELGHYIFSRLFGVRVLEFAIGMGPKLWSKKERIRPSGSMHFQSAVT